LAFAPFVCRAGVELEDELAAELQFTWIVGAGYLAEVAIGEAGIDIVELGRLRC